MKKTLFFLIILVLSTVSFGQINNLQPKRIVFYDKYKFEDDKNGIEKYVKALDTLGYICIFESDPEKRKAAYNRAYENRYKLIIEPVQNEISQSLKQIEIKNDVVILDLSKLDENGQILALDEKLDVSQPLIAFFNEYFKTNIKQNLSFNPPETKIGTINTDSLNDEKSGIKILTTMFAETSNQIKKETGTAPNFTEIKARIFKDESKSKIFQQIGNSIQSYSMKKGYSLVFDSREKLPLELSNFQTQDITNDFISYYNQSNP
jgi:hypothetical protein